MMHHLVGFYLDLFSLLKQNETLQLVVLQFIIESLVIAGGENRLIRGSLILGLNDFP